MTADPHALEPTVARLAALAHQTRLRAFRTLMAAGPEGMRAGDLARALGVAPNTMSAHFNVLSQAGLVRMRRVGRTNIYSVHVETIAELLSYLVSDCCNGHPEVCAPLTRSIGAGALACD